MKCDHDVVLFYTTDDDGIHAECKQIYTRTGAQWCGFRKHLGFDPTPAMAIEAQREHDERDLP